MVWSLRGRGRRGRSRRSRSQHRGHSRRRARLPWRWKRERQSSRRRLHRRRLPSSSLQHRIGARLLQLEEGRRQPARPMRQQAPAAPRRRLPALLLLPLHRRLLLPRVRAAGAPPHQAQTCVLCWARLPARCLRPSSRSCRSEAWRCCRWRTPSTRTSPAGCRCVGSFFVCVCRMEWQHGGLANLLMHIIHIPSARLLVNCLCGWLPWCVQLAGAMAAGSSGGSVRDELRAVGRNGEQAVLRWAALQAGGCNRTQRGTVCITVPRAMGALRVPLALCSYCGNVAIPRIPPVQGIQAVCQLLRRSSARQPR